MRYMIAILGFVLATMMLWDAFEVIILPRRVTHRFRFSKFFYRSTWQLRSVIAEWITGDKRRESYLSIFGPLSLLLLLCVWAMGIIAGFAMLQWGLQDRLVGQSVTSFFTYLYMSGTTFFTLGLGDVLAWGRVGRTLVVVEAGLGFAFLGAVISFLPMLYQTFSRREVSISLLDSRAGSPPSAGELLRRNGEDMSELRRLLVDWERWSAEVLESHLSYPFLVYFRSQHTNQSWLAALTTILDACALVMAGIDGGPKRQAQLTFAKARHAVVELSQIFVLSPPTLAPDRLPSSSFSVLGKMLAETGVTLRDDVATETRLRELRRMYEPNVQALSDYLLFLLPQWFRINQTPDSWQISNWLTPILSTENSAMQETNAKRFAEG
jgi:Ion channel